jgi:hypothetical protein
MKRDEIIDVDDGTSITGAGVNILMNPASMHPGNTFEMNSEAGYSQLGGAAGSHYDEMSIGHQHQISTQ